MGERRRRHKSGNMYKGPMGMNNGVGMDGGNGDRVGTGQERARGKKVEQL